MAARRLDPDTERLVNYAADLLVIESHERASKGCSGVMTLRLSWEGGRLKRVICTPESIFDAPPQDWSPAS